METNNLNTIGANCINLLLTFFRRPEFLHADIPKYINMKGLQNTAIKAKLLFHQSVSLPR